MMASAIASYQLKLMLHSRYTLSSILPKIADLRQKIGDFYFFTIHDSLNLVNREYVFLGYNLTLTHPCGHNEPTTADR